MDQTAQEFLDVLQDGKGYSENTIAAYRNDLGQFCDFLREKKVAGPSADRIAWSAIAQNHILEYVLFLKEREYTTSTVARKVAAVKSFFHHLIDRQVIPQNPTEALETPRVKKQKPSSISYEDVERLLAEPGKQDTPQARRDQALLEVLYATGMRVSEVVALDIDDVSFGPAQIRCKGRNGKERTMPLGPRAARTVQTYLHDARARLMPTAREVALFLNHRGQRLTRQGLWLIIKRYVEAVGIESEVTPYTLRHSFATHMLREGRGLQEVQRLLGHANVSTTQIYAELAGQTDDRTIGN